MNPNRVVVHYMQGNRSRVAFRLLAESQAKPGESPHECPDAQVIPLNMNPQSQISNLKSQIHHSSPNFFLFSSHSAVSRLFSEDSAWPVRMASTSSRVR